MNAVEIEEAISLLVEQPFDAKEFPYLFLEAFGNKEATLKRLKSGVGNDSDIAQGVLQRQNIHIATCQEGKVSETLIKLRTSPATLKGKVKFILATDGKDFEAEDLTSDDAAIVCRYLDFPNYFGFFLALAGISTVKQIRESSFDIRATSRLNKLYIELLQNNPGWGTSERRHDMNHFMARLIFCFFAEDTDIFNGKDIFTNAIEQITAKDSSDTHEVISEIFRAMNTKNNDRQTANIKRWANSFPYVNGGLFSGNIETPRFSRIARSYLMHVGKLDWTKINPDIFGSMIQAVADDDERGSLGMHYTSVPNILKVLNPLFLNELRQELEIAGDNSRKLLALRKRIARIRVFDPACGSGNFLVIAYKQLREIESEINKRRDEKNLRSEIPLTNYRGIELRDFSAEVARLALIIAEYQCDVLYLGQKEALAEFLPLESQNWITCGNALRLDWLSICPPTGTGVKITSDDLFNSPLEQAQIDFANEGGETYICGNPPYKGSKWQSKEQKEDLKNVFDKLIKNWKSLDYVAGWFWKAAEYSAKNRGASALVSTNSICQGHQVPIIWPAIFKTGNQITFAHTSFKWKNLASHNAGVTVVIVGISNNQTAPKNIYTTTEEGIDLAKEATNINPYLIAGANIIVEARQKPLNEALGNMQFGNHPYYGTPLIFSSEEAKSIIAEDHEASNFIRPIYGSKEFIQNTPRACMWVTDEQAPLAMKIASLKSKADLTAIHRQAAKQDETAKKLVATPYRFRDTWTAKNNLIVVPGVSSENREYLPCGVLSNNVIISNKAFALYDAPLWNMALIVSRLHLTWVASVCVRMRTDYSYSNTLGWNTFPVPQLTEKNKEDLTRCAENILLAREEHFPATIADLYDPEKMPENLRYAHNQNDEILERIYIGRRFKNNTEQLEKLFELYTKMTTQITKAS